MLVEAGLQLIVHLNLFFDSLLELPVGALTDPQRALNTFHAFGLFHGGCQLLLVLGLGLTSRDERLRLHLAREIFSFLQEHLLVEQVHVCHLTIRLERVQLVVNAVLTFLARVADHGVEARVLRRELTTNMMEARTRRRAVQLRVLGGRHVGTSLSVELDLLLPRLDRVTVG